ncbi:hypothetical protein [Streptomyces sp. NBC_01198]|uniref:hypothetical protein n=1 Tax=Streptomyces sp. NBC_01198 TaxID=2903769 RepID=UPI002E0DCA49|nr:hypothetical protein OG702_24445 [Streptomyces sp. NBC_01198]
MTHTPTGRMSRDARTGAGLPAPRGSVPAPPPGPPGPVRRRAWAESAARMRAAATTEPGRLRIIGAVLALVVVAFGAVTAWQVTDRSTAADNVTKHSAPLSATAAEIYRSLADADATVTGGFLVGGLQPEKDSDRYTNDITTASRLISEAAANSEGSPQARAEIRTLNEQLPQYVELVTAAQTNNRHGLPVGGAYLRYANSQMRRHGGLLAAADQLNQIETDRLGHDYSSAKALPYASWALGAVALGGLLWAQRRHYRRTNRVFNHGMVAASAASAVVLLWLVAGHTIARSQLEHSYAHGARSVQVLNNARISVLQARGDENLTLVARGSGQDYETKFGDGMEVLAGVDPKGVGGQLAQALRLADNSAGSDPVNAAVKGVQTWRARHTAERKSDDSGDYTTAVAEVIGGKDSKGKTVDQTTGSCFDVVDASLQRAVTHEQQEFQDAADSGRGALTLLPYGAALLAVLAAAGALVGIGRRLSEYR